MNALDIIFIVLLATGAIYGLFKGAVMEISSFVGILLGVYVSRGYSSDATVWLQSIAQMTDGTALVVAHIVLFLATIIVLHFVAKLIDKILSVVLLSWLNRLLGMLFGAMKVLIVLSFFVNITMFFFEKTPNIENPELIKTSMLYEPIGNVLGAILRIGGEYV